MKIGLIGTGNMGRALMAGYLKANPAQTEKVFAFDLSQTSLAAFTEATGASGCNSIADLAGKSDILILAVKPNNIEDVLVELRDQALIKGKLILSIAAGISIDFMANILLGQVGSAGPGDAVASGPAGGSKAGPGLLPSDLKLARAMPNTPALIGRGVTALVRGANLSDEELAQLEKILSSVGLVEEVAEGLIDSVIGVAGSAPAYVYMFIEAMADGAVALGMDRQQAYRFAAGTVAGAAEMVLETGDHPGELKDKVCSPGGTTIEAVRVLEERGFKSAVFEGVKAAGAKSKEISK